MGGKTKVKNSHPLVELLVEITFRGTSRAIRWVGLSCFEYLSILLRGVCRFIYLFLIIKIKIREYPGHPILIGRAR